MLGIQLILSSLLQIQICVYEINQLPRRPLPVGDFDQTDWFIQGELGLTCWAE
jgi:hypothetical protein